VSGQDIGDDIPTDQHVCADTIIKYTLFGFPGSTVEWYVDDVHLTGKDVVVPNNTIDPPASGGNVIHGGLTYNRALLNYTWSLSGGNTIENHSLKIQEISADPAACSTGVSNPGLAVHVHKKPILVLPVPTHAVCASDKGSLSVSVTATVPAALQLQYKLVNVTASSETDWINDNLNHIFNDLDPATYKVQIRYVLSTDNSIVVKGSWSESADVELRQEDNTDPVITNMPTDILVTNCMQVVNWVEPTATDNCGTPTLTSNHSSGKAFPAGETIVTYTANDGTNSVQESFKITVQDGGTAPLICFESTNYAIGKTAIQSSTYPNGTASKAVDGNTNGVWANNSVTHTNNDMNAWWQVDLGAEEAVDYVNVFRRTDCCTDRLVNFYVMLSNNDLQSVTLADALIDPNVESYYVEGNPGNLKRILTSGNSARYVKIQLSARNHLSLAEVEVIGCTANDRNDIPIIAENGRCGAHVSWDAPAAVDNCGIVTLSSNHNSGDDFPVGTTTVTYTATDGTNETTSSFDVIVTDDQDPILTNCPTDITVGACANTVTWTAPTANDNCSATLASTHNSGDVFPVGTTTVTYTATDGASNEATCSFDVTILTVVTIDVIETKSIICNGSNAQVTITAGGGDGSYTYSDDGINYQALNTFNLPAGTHTLYVKDGNNCVAQKDITINEPDAILTNLTISTSNICFGDAGVITIVGYESDVNYTLFEGLNSLAYSASVSGTDLILTINNTVLNTEKTYNITIKAERGGCTLDMDTGVSISVKPNPNPSEITF